MHADAADAPSRATVLYSGNVQGVGFRYRTLVVAQGFAVNGFVRNLPDGTVEVVAEGDGPVVRAFVTMVGARLGGHIVDSAARWAPATGEFDGFVVRY